MTVLPTRELVLYRFVEQHGATAAVVQADLCDADDRLRLIDQAWNFLGQPTTWVNNAGADVLTGEAASWGSA